MVQNFNSPVAMLPASVVVLSQSPEKVVVLPLTCTPNTVCLPPLSLITFPVITSFPIFAFVELSNVRNSTVVSFLKYYGSFAAIGGCCIRSYTIVFNWPLWNNFLYQSQVHQ